ncbi:MAG: tyrosine-protein phosphatase, partial [Erysipelotrichaceae bacterium]|nr:tyrosine-protein phosphatase [Erysipelotrichaceae bacterium]
MSEKEGPYLVHCTEGKDRTGFVIMLLEALAGAPYQQIADDYMLTYDNYYKINPEKEPAKYRTILEKNLDAMLKFVVNDDKADFKTVELAPYARKYLVNSGMSDVQVDRLLARLGGN